MEAAQNSNSKETAEAAEAVVVNEAKKGGAAAMQFDPNASAEEKAAQARAVRNSHFHDIQFESPLGVASYRSPNVPALLTLVELGYTFDEWRCSSRWRHVNHTLRSTDPVV